MKIQEKSFLVISGLIVIVLIVISIFYTTILLASYQALENRYIENDLDLAVSKFNDVLYTMSNIASDWGPWDDTVEFVHGRDPNYLHSNLQPYGFDNLDLNLICITDVNGTVLFSGSYDIQNKKMVGVPAFFTTKIDPSDPLMNMTDPHKVTAGIILLKDDPMLVVSQPVMYSNFSGMPHGVIIMGRYLNSAEIARLAELSEPTLAFTRITDPGLPTDLAPRLRQYSGPGGIIEPLDDDRVAGYALIRDLYGNEALVLSITEPRNIYHQGWNTLVQVLVIILGAGLVLAIGVTYLLDRTLLRRIHSLADQITTIENATTVTTRVAMDGDDELFDLASEMNRMLTTIEKTHEGLIQSELRFRELADLLPQAVYEADMEGNLTYTNRIGLELFRYSEDDFREGFNIMNAIVPEDRERVVAVFRAMQTGKTGTQSHEYIATRKDGTTFPVAIYSSLIVIAGKTVGYRGIIIDITERKRAEDALRLANRQLSLLTGITRHDISNQMMILRGNVTLLERQQTDNSTSDFFSKIRRAADRISDMIQFTREYESIGTRLPVWQDCRTLAETAIRQAPHGSVVIENDIPAGAEIYADPLIAKAFYNLIDNAARHGGKISRIRLFVRDAGENPCIVCEDDGVGIPADEKQKIFERGFGKNTGLGLFLIKEILIITGMRIQETGDPGQGARFEIIVPRGNWRITSGR